MQVILNNGKEEIDFTSIVLKQMAGELTREQVQELINKARREEHSHLTPAQKNIQKKYE